MKLFPFPSYLILILNRFRFDTMTPTSHVSWYCLDWGRSVLGEKSLIDPEGTQLGWRYLDGLMYSRWTDTGRKGKLDRKEKWKWCLHETHPLRASTRSRLLLRNVTSLLHEFVRLIFYATVVYNAADPTAQPSSHSTLPNPLFDRTFYQLSRIWRRGSGIWSCW